MADFIRPELRAAMWRWRDVIFAAGIATVGLWWLIGSSGVIRGLGGVLVLLGIGLALAGTQRARFGRGTGGPGIVHVDERRLTYFGPLTGGVIDMGDLVRLELEPKALPAPHWVLTGPGGQSVAIPVNAEGADALFDVFAALPGIQTEKMLDVLERTPQARVVIWSRARPMLN
jgi:hypothetical protein